MGESASNKYTPMFAVDEEQLKKLNEFREKHWRCGSKAAIGGAVTYEFTPTSLGVVVVIKCHCGAKLDVSDYQDW
jgi:hypothetical protein